HSTALVPDGVRPPPLQIGERALRMHLFGGIGGSDGEPVAGWTATGHFAFGEAEVVEDRLSGAPRLAIRYHQIYANNPDGIVAGRQDWSAYGGNLQRGWLGTRPFSDLLIPVGGELLDAIALQAEILAARYRSGDGEGVALVTPATSCVQDSSQALWIALQQLRRQGERGALPAGERQRLERLNRALSHLLTPFGRVRGDWAHNSRLALADGGGSFRASQSLQDVLLSWRSLLPRGAHDTFAAEALRAGLPLQVLRTNQIPGLDPRLEPIAPTTLLGQQPLLGTAVARLGDALFPPPLNGGRAWPLLILAVYGPMALLLGWRSGFLPRRWQWPPLPQLLRRSAGYLLMPAFGEELVFRGLLLPQPIEGFSAAATLAWIALSTGLFVLYHPLAARLWYPQGRTLFADPRFLVQCSLLGLA
ncbi:MAG: type II CAAX prenyl endopeptidase Rce1 family protein, partial [Cyanobium sp.]